MEKKRFVAVVLVCSVLAGACMAQKVENLSESLPYEAFYNPADAESPAGKILPKMRMSGDTLFVAMSTGLYAKDVEKDGAFSLYAFPDMPVLDFVRSGNRLMVLSMKRSSQTDSLLLVSEDRGATFRDGTPRIEGLLSVNGMAQNPLDPESLLIATDKGLYKSPDFGETWTKLSDTVLDYPVLRFHPADTALVFMAGSSTQTQKGLVFRLDLENGESSVYETEGEGRFMDLLFDSGNPEQMWITGSGSEKICRSQDGGKTWQGMNTAAMEWNAQVPRFTRIFGSRTGTDTLYAVAGTQNSEVCVWRSLDAGENWDSLFYECFFYGEVIVYPSDIVQHGKDFFFYFNTGVFRLDLQQAVSATDIGRVQADPFFGMLQNTPNPFGGATVVRYRLPETAEEACFVIYDLQGREVFRTLLSGQGWSEIEIGADVFPAAGTYLYTMVCNGQKLPAKRMCVVK